MVLTQPTLLGSLILKLQRCVFDILLLDADKSVKFISNALEVLAMLESPLMVKFSFFTDGSLI